MGKKYIIEVEDKPFELLSEDGFTSEKLFRVKGFNSLVFDWNGLNMLTPYTEDSAYAHGYTEAESKYREIRDELEKQAHQRGYEEAYDTAYADAEKIYESGKRAMYQKGLKDAWEAARKIRDMSWKEQKEVFGTDYYADIIALPVSEVIEKIRQYEQEQEEQIQVGDEVITASGKAVVMGVGPVHFEYVYADGSHGYDEVKNVKKTGRHFPEIVEVLQKMKE